MPLTSAARAEAAQVDGRTVLTTLRSAVPTALRETADGLLLVASAFGPLGGDCTSVDVVVRPGAALRVGSAAAQLAQPGATDPVSRSRVHLDVQAHGHLRWWPQPLVVTDGAEHRVDLDVTVAPTGSAVVVETVVLGRTGARPGRYRSRWRVEHGGDELLAVDLDVGAGAADGWDGPAGTGGARVLVTALAVGPHPPAHDVRVPGGEVLRLAGAGVLLSWLGPDAVAAAAAVDAFLTALPSTPRDLRPR